MTSRTWQERRNAGLEVMSRLLGHPVGPDDAQRREETQGALSTWAIDHVLGDVWSRPQLSRRDRSMVVVACLVSLRADQELRVHTRGALHHGVSIEEIYEIVHQCAVYAGFPTAIASRRVVDDVIASVAPDYVEQPRTVPERLGDDERRSRAAAVLARMAGRAEPETPETTRQRLASVLGGVGELAHDWAFGEVWSRAQLGPRDRSMVTVAVLMALGQTDELTHHARVAHLHGMTADELAEVAVQATVYVGFPRAVSAHRTIVAALAPPAVAVTTSAQQQDQQDDDQDPPHDDASSSKR